MLAAMALRTGGLPYGFTGTVNFTSSGQTWTVPAGVTSVSLLMAGPSGLLGTATVFPVTPRPSTTTLTTDNSGNPISPPATVGIGGGGGGGLIWFMALTVAPGDTLSLPTYDNTAPFDSVFTTFNFQRNGVTVASVNRGGRAANGATTSNVLYMVGGDGGSATVTAIGTANGGQHSIAGNATPYTIAGTNGPNGSITTSTNINGTNIASFFAGGGAGGIGGILLPTGSAVNGGKGGTTGGTLNNVNGTQFGPYGGGGQGYGPGEYYLTDTASSSYFQLLCRIYYNV